MEIKNKNILIIAPHADDAEAGMGAVIHRLVKSNNIHLIVLSLPPRVDRIEVRLEMYEALENLGVKTSQVTEFNMDPQNFPRQGVLQLLYDYNRDHRPDIVFLPNSRDVHQSHQIAFEEGRRAFKHSTLLGYEMPWNSFGFDNQVYIQVTIDDLTAKVKSINNYRTQMDREMFRNNQSLNLAAVRGQQIGVPYAECFEAIRIIV